MFEKIALVTAVILPLFNIPLIVRIVQRKSSNDISLSWALGVWICILLMAPSGFQSEDIVWRTFNFMNVALFSCVAITVLKYRNWKERG
ncbi:MAG TPA: hypothetical protein P5160_08605 [Candidatus Omnitrophota bacterium]|nr:hypothetical protein [Candidatus Omnitrophota bacterium]